MSEEISKYHVLEDGGRIKSAGVSMDFVFDQGAEFQSNPGPESASQITKTFQALRDNPPSSIRERFFPLERAEVKAQTRRSPALYRPVLKNDQGAGKFLPFEIAKNGEGQQFPIRVAFEEGYVIPEAYFQDQVIAKGYPESVVRELQAVQNHFKEGDLYEARLAFERLQEASEEEHIVFRREAQVGRSGLMFIHPTRADQKIVIPQEMAAGAEDRVNQQIEQLVDIAGKKKRLFAEANNLPYRMLDEFSLPLYFQADMHVLPNGRLLVGEFQIPDVGLFLNRLPDQGSSILADVHTIVGSMKDKVADGFSETIKIIEKAKGPIPIYLVTRSEVIGNREDVLEIRELEEIKDALSERGHTAKVISAADAAKISDQSIMFLFNLYPQSEEFGQLCRSYLQDAQRNLTMIPDPFIRAAEREITEYDHIVLSRRDIENLQALVKEIESTDTRKEKVYTQVMALDYFLRKLGIEEDVLHICHPSFRTPIPVYRYDTRSFHIAANILQEVGLDNVSIRSIPLSPDRSVVKDIDGGGLYATFRFMFLRKD